MMKLYATFGLILFVFTSWISCAEVQVTVKKRADERLGVILTTFNYPNLNKVLRDDLHYSGHFVVAKTSSAIQNATRSDRKASQLNTSLWKSFSEDIIVKIGMKENSSTVSYEAFAFDRVSGRSILAKRYQGAVREKRKLIHQFSDDLVNSLTGFPGIATLRITYSKQISRKAKEVFFCDSDGKNEVQLTRDNTLILSPRWNPKSLELMYTTYKTGFPTIMVHMLKSGKRQVLSRFPGFNGSAAYSKDGKRIAFVLSKDGNPEIYLMNRDRSGFKRLTRSKGVDESPVWSSDGKHLVFVSNRRGSVQIYRMNLASKKIKRLTFEGSYNTSPDWSWLGNKIAYTRMSRGKGNIYVLDLATNKNEFITYGEDPAWAPDGRHIAYFQTQNGVKQLFVVDTPTKIIRQISFGRQNCLTPSWSLY